MLNIRGVVCAISLLLAFAGSCVSAAPSSASQIAKEILAASGRSNGVVLHIGAGTGQLPALTAELAAQSGMVVHGLALDAPSLSRARGAIAEKKVVGQAMVECIPPSPLPYLDNIGTIVVVDDAALVEKAGVKQDDLLRVVSPGGLLFVFSQGKWNRTLKPFPKDTDNWTHPNHDAGNTHTSSDPLLRFPMSLAWQDGVPMNIVAWAAVRAIVIDRGRTFSVGTTELENVPGINGGLPKKEEYLTARDLFNGQVLWKHPLGTVNEGAALTSANPATLVASEGRVYAYQKDRLVAFDGATGKQLVEFPVKNQPVRLLMLDGVLVSAGWAGRELAKEQEFSNANGLWAPWTPKTPDGAVEAFDTKTGKLLWSATGAAASMLAADEHVYIVRREGNPATKESVTGIDIKTGKELWHAEGETLASQTWLHLGVAGNGIVTVVRAREKMISVLDGKTGKKLWETAGALKAVTPLWDGKLWNAGKTYDLLTGEEKGTFTGPLNDAMCTPSAWVRNTLISSRGGTYIELKDADEKGQHKKLASDTISAVRGSCVGGFVEGYGMLVTAQNNCLCNPGQIPGATGIASVPPPDESTFTAARPVEKGPAFGQVKLTATQPGDWPMFRYALDRSSATATAVPDNLKLAWTSAATTPRNGALAPSWNARLRDCVTSPVAANGKVFVASRETGQLVALDAVTGKEMWRFQTGGRIDAPPTIFGDLCVAGSNDGYLYALRASDGKLAWRLRLAPVERRMVSFATLESSWPVMGSPIVTEKAIFATAGRSAQADGGMIVAAIDPLTGTTQWISRVPPKAKRQNDVLAMKDGKLTLHQMLIDPGTGSIAVPDVPIAKYSCLEGFVDGIWTRMTCRRSGKYRFGDVVADAVTWNNQYVYGRMTWGKQYFAISHDKTIGEGGKLQKEAYQYQVPEPADSACESLSLSGDKLVTAIRLVPKSGPATGEVRILSAADGKQISTIALPAPPTFQAVAITDGRLFVAMEDGQVACLTKQ